MANKSAGSLEPTSAGKGKWWEGIDSADLSELQALAKDINATIDKTVKHVARGKIRAILLMIKPSASGEKRTRWFSRNSMPIT
jgi:hypothetical protein